MTGVAAFGVATDLFDFFALLWTAGAAFGSSEGASTGFGRITFFPLNGLGDAFFGVTVLAGVSFIALRVVRRLTGVFFGVFFAVISSFAGVTGFSETGSN